MRLDRAEHELALLGLVAIERGDDLQDMGGA
jgi:hypothetical protein